MPTIESFLFQSEGLMLSAILHRPDTELPAPAIVMCHGWTGHKIEPGRVFVKTARRLAEAGIVVLRFDCRGSGDSEGDFQDMTISGEVLDANRALEVLCATRGVDQERIGILGFSLGGCVAPLAAQAFGNVKTACLWAPVSNPARQFQRITDEMKGDYLDMGQNIQGRCFVNDLPNHHPADFVAGWNRPVFVIRGTNDESVTEESARAYLTGPGRREFMPIEGADHVWSRSDWQAQLMDATVRWFRETL